MLNWDTTREDMSTIHTIVTQARAAFRRAGLVARSPLDIEMDITACHCNGTPLRLTDMVDAPDADLLHDVCGIARHLDRETGQLRDGFMPRYAGKVGFVEATR